MTTAATIFLSALALPPPAASQIRRPPEAEIIRLLTSDVYEEWMDGLTWSDGIPPEERSPALLTAMIAAFDQQVEWYRGKSGPSDPSFEHLGEAYGEASTQLADRLAATRDPRVLPSLAWHAYNRGPIQRLFAFGHEAVPHLLAAITSPDVTGWVAVHAVEVLKCIVSVLGPGDYEEEIAEAVALYRPGLLQCYVYVPLDAEVIRLLTSDVYEEWLDGASWSLHVTPSERSPALLAAMRDALEQQVEWNRLQTGPGHPSFHHTGEAYGQTSAILARELAATANPGTLPALAWHARDGGTVAQALFGFGHEAVPHLLAVAASPDASADVAGTARNVLRCIVSVHGPGDYEEEIAEAVALHRGGPPDCDGLRR